MSINYTLLLERFKLLLIGLATGDSLGSTSETKHNRDIPYLFKNISHTGWPFKQAGGGPFNLKPGSPTDETSMAFCFLESSRELYRFEPADVVRRLIDWKRSNPLGLKAQEVSALSWIACGNEWYEGGMNEFAKHPDRCGNGALVRNGIIPGMSANLNDLFRYSTQQCIMTLYPPIAVICCCAHSYLILNLISGGTLNSDWRRNFLLMFRMWLRGEKDKGVNVWHETVGTTLEYDLQRFMEVDLDKKAWNPLARDWSEKADCALLTFRIAYWALMWSLSNDEFTVPHTFLPERVFRMRGPYVLGWTALIGHHSDTYCAVAGPLIAAAHGGLPPGMTRGLKVLDKIYNA